MLRFLYVWSFIDKIKFVYRVAMQIEMLYNIKL